ncbi:hypothetical protein [Microbacterium sp. 2FI]|uniref:hypothetical protein n=1 Tax=Microbacterium sp. 2FI TaxID=2502193 RepID=UPI0010F73D68|nr:hypothetical protein [Microbacterium sp. 2FI]
MTAFRGLAPQSPVLLTVTIVVWLLALLGALALLWVGVFDVGAPVDPGTAWSLEINSGLVLAGVLANIAVAFAGWMLFASPIWAALVAAPSVGIAVLVLWDGESFLPQLAVGPLCVASLGAAVVLVVLHLVARARASEAVPA